MKMMGTERTRWLSDWQVKQVDDDELRARLARAVEDKDHADVRRFGHELQLRANRAAREREQQAKQRLL